MYSRRVGRRRVQSQLIQFVGPECEVNESKQCFRHKRSIENEKPQTNCIYLHHKSVKAHAECEVRSMFGKE